MVNENYFQFDRKMKPESIAEGSQIFRYPVAGFRSWNLALVHRNQETFGNQILAKLAKI
jgi:hypothetical protein